MLILQEAAMSLCRSIFTIWFAWNSLPVEEQEKVIGRRKFNDVELSDEEKPSKCA